MEKLGINPAWLVTTFVNLILIAALLSIVALFILSFARSSGFISRGGETRPAPLDILKARYAGGEITKEQFEQIKKDLES